MFLELKFICNEVFGSANEFGDDFDVDDFMDKINVVFQTHVHAFSTTTLTGFVFCMMRFIFGSCQLFTSLRDGNRPHRIVGRAKNLIAMYSGPTQFKK